ncbi:MAG TPA: glycoside hydrolase family 3 C-terminal domain-containing protein, partial [Propionibacteriaceae bacterium]|nr:glycoside hydrolase family 3 C-terminal domain-containing protein [Propionibacteriaceae bacterium]
MDIQAIINDLTLEEKAALVSGDDFWHTVGIERHGVPRIMMSDGPHGLRTQKTDEQDQAGIGGSEPATCFPTACNLHASWDPELVKQVGAAIATEARSLGVSIVLGPGANIKRSPLCGRNFEYISEDPYLSGTMATAMVQGIQSRNVGTSLKHFAANNQETDRLRVSAEVDERTLREIYFPAYEMTVKNAKPWTVMCSYNALNGTLVSKNRWLLTDVLRDEWGYDGLVVSDWGAVGDRVASVQAGMDLEMPPSKGRSDVAVVEAVTNGSLSMDDLDLCVHRVLELVDKSAQVLADEGTPVDFDAHHALSRAAAAQGCVLLKNTGVLPLKQGGRLAVLGEFARTTRFQGGGSSEVNTTKVDKALDAFAEVFGEVPFAPAYAFDGNDENLLEDAVLLAKEADVAVLFVGLTDAEESEGFDRTHMFLPANQVAAIKAVTHANPNTVVVLCNGSLVSMTEWHDGPAAILEAWLGGQAIGGAIVDVLSGAVNPAARLCETVPLRLEDNPSYGNFPGDSRSVRYGEGILVGYRSYDYKKQDVLYPFGFGLSYTTFDYDNLIVTQSGSVADGTLAAQVTLTVKNTGKVAGSEVVQVYVADPETSVLRPVRE